MTEKQSLTHNSGSFHSWKITFQEGFCVLCSSREAKRDFKSFYGNNRNEKERRRGKKKKKKLGTNIKFFSEINTLLLSEHIRRSGQQQTGMSQYFKTD